MPDISRITDIMSAIVVDESQRAFTDNDEFDYDIGLMPVQSSDDNDDLSFEMAAWAVFRLNCPESESRSVMGLTAPLKYFSNDGFRSIVQKTLGEMQFNRIAAALVLESVDDYDAGE